MITVKVPKILRRIFNIHPDIIVPAMYKGMKTGLYRIEGTAKENLSGKILNVRTGRLRNSIATQAAIKGTRVEGAIGSNVVYARIHERGGEIKPVRAKALRFRIDGQWKTVQKVRIPSRPYLRPAIEDNIQALEGDIGAAINAAFLRSK